MGNRTHYPWYSWSVIVNVVALLVLVLPVASARAAVAATPAVPATRPAAGLAAVIDLHGEINDVSAAFLFSRFAQARAAGANTIIIDIDTYGGLVTSALEISHFIKQQRDLHVIAYVNTKAYSAGSMIAVACDEIVMNPTAAIGDCAPIRTSGDGTMQTMGEAERAKAASPILTDFEDSAQRNGISVALVKAMVSSDLVVHWVENQATSERRFVDQDQWVALNKDANWRIVRDEDVSDPIDGPNTLLTVNSKVALKLGLARQIIDGIDTLAQERGLRIVRHYQVDAWQHFVAFISAGWVRSILLSLFFLCIYIALHVPGHGMAEVGAVLTLALGVGVPILTGYAQWWEILLLLVGIALLAVELFLIPGFGVTGILGIVMIVVGLLMTFVMPEPDRSPLALPTLPGTWASLQNGLGYLLVALIGSIVGSAIFRQFLPRIPIFNRLMLTTVVGSTETAAAGSLSRIEPGDRVPGRGASGIAVSHLTPGGSVEFRDSAGAVHIVSVVCDGYAERGASVVVTGVDGPSIYVKKAEE